MTDMHTYELLNLDLGEHPPREFEVGPFTLRVVDNYAEARARIPQLGRTEVRWEFTSNGGGRTEAKVPPHFGEPVVTAKASCPSEHQPSAILVYEKPAGAIWDLCHLLSFLSGHRVFLPDDKRRFFHQKTVQGAVQAGEIPQAAAHAWAHLGQFSTLRRKTAFWLAVQSKATSEAEIRAIMSSVALECLMRDDRFQATAAETPKGLEELLGDVRKVIDNSAVDDDTKTRLKSAVGGWGKSSLVQSLIAMLAHLGLAPPAKNAVQMKRIKFINSCRNRLVHGGDIPLPDWIQDADRARSLSIWFAAYFLPALVDECIHNFLDITNFNWPTQHTALLKEYLANGTWDGRDPSA
jgi:hypothetical protein